MLTRIPKLRANTKLIISALTAVVSISARGALRNLSGIAALIAGWSTIGSAQFITADDVPVRAVHLYSIEVSNEPLIDNWQVIEGEFSDIDRIIIGLDAAVFAGSTVIEYTLWITYEARRWLSFDREGMIRLTIDGHTSIMESISRAQPSIPSGRMIERFEFRISKDQLDAVLQGTDVSLIITLGNATATRQLRSEEKESLRGFRHQVGE